MSFTSNALQNDCTIDFAKYVNILLCNVTVQWFPLFSVLKTKSCYDTNFVFIGCPGTCHNDCWWSVDSPHKGLVMRKVFPCHDVIVQGTKLTWECLRFVAITCGLKCNRLINSWWDAMSAIIINLAIFNINIPHVIFINLNNIQSDTVESITIGLFTGILFYLHHVFGIWTTQ